ncbi:hypothetical protein LCGC14_0988280 [marine sediment metagenome]|uniref:Uncharacterized protein n=1 Tax=marine sediment metagenome TaxID=412755 RepID=A0A0F9NB74_9ZZZZ
MKNFIIALLLTATSTAAQTNVTALSEKEKALHRWGFCRAIQVSLEIGDNRRHNDIIGIHRLLYDNGAATPENDPQGIFEKSTDDTKVQLLTAKIEVSNTMLEECENDMRLILADNYVPHFRYVTK